MQFIEIEYNSQRYQEELALRDKILRKPLGLSIYDEVGDEESKFWHFGIIQDGILIACLVAQPLEQQTVSAGQMAVSNFLQGQGLGKILVTEAEQKLQRQGIKHVFLAARVSAQGFYKKLGYITEGDTFTKVGIPHIKMSKSLT